MCTEPSKAGSATYDPPRGATGPSSAGSAVTRTSLQRSTSAAMMQSARLSGERVAVDGLRRGGAEGAAGHVDVPQQAAHHLGGGFVTQLRDQGVGVQDPSRSLRSLILGLLAGLSA